MRDVVVTIHGIRTYGEWQTNLAKALHERCAALGRERPLVITYQFGYFSAPALAIPLLRALEVRRFRAWLGNVLRDHPDSTLSLVAHSFGTFVAGRALLDLPEADLSRVETVIFAGSILPQSFRWDRIVGAHRIRRVINDCGTRDSILLLSQLFILGGGLAGRCGFSGAHDSEGRGVTNRYFPFGHGGYFVKRDDDTHYLRFWIPVLLGAVPEPCDARGTSVYAGIKTTVLQNLAPVKILIYLGIVGSFAAAIYLPQRREAEARIVESNFEAARQNIRAGRYAAASGAIGKVLEHQPQHRAARFLQPILDHTTWSTDVEALSLPAVSGNGAFQIGSSNTFSNSLEIRGTGLPKAPAPSEAMKAALASCARQPELEVEAPLLSYSGAAAFVAGAPGILCDLQRGRVTQKFEGPARPVATQARQTDVIAVRHARRVLVWSAQSGQPMLDRTFPRAPAALALDDMGRWLAVGFANGELLLTNLATNEQRSLKVMSMSELQMTASHDRLRILVCRSAPGGDPERRNTLCPLRSGADQQRGIESVPERLQTEIWDSTEGRSVRLLRAEFAKAFGATLIGAGRYVLVSEAEKGLTLRRAHRGRPLAQLSAQPATDIAVSRDEQVLAWTSGASTHVISTASGRDLTPNREASRPRLALSPDGRYLIEWEGACDIRAPCGNYTGGIVVSHVTELEAYRPSRLDCDKATAEAARVACELLADQKRATSNDEEEPNLFLDRLTRSRYQVNVSLLKPEYSMPREVKGVKFTQWHDARSRIVIRPRNGDSAVSSIEISGHVLSVAAAPDGNHFATLVCQLDDKLPDHRDCRVYRIGTWTRGRENVASFNATALGSLGDFGYRDLIFDARSKNVFRVELSAGVAYGGLLLYRYPAATHTDGTEVRTLVEEDDISELVPHPGSWFPADRSSVVTLADPSDPAETTQFANIDIGTGDIRFLLGNSGTGPYRFASGPAEEWLAGASANTGIQVWDMRTGKEIWSLAPVKYYVPDILDPFGPEDSDDVEEDEDTGTLEYPAEQEPCGYETPEWDIRLSDDARWVALQCKDLVEVMRLAR